MFGFRRRDDIYESRIAELKEAHEAERRALNKVIDALAEQIEYLRLTFGKPSAAQAAPWSGLDIKFEGEPEPQFLSEEEEDLLALRESELISEPELAAMRLRLTKT